MGIFRKRKGDADQTVGIKLLKVYNDSFDVNELEAVKVAWVGEELLVKSKLFIRPTCLLGKVGHCQLDQFRDMVWCAIHALREIVSREGDQGVFLNSREDTLKRTAGIKYVITRYDMYNKRYVPPYCIHARNPP
jgi:hypothetical protein